MKHIVIDFEMQHGEMQLLQSAPNVYQTEIIEIGAVMLNDKFEFVSEFKSYVHPSYGKLSDNIAILTGIKDSDIRDAPLISEAVSSLFAWIGDGEFTVYAWSTADYTQLSRELAGKELMHIILQDLHAHWVDFQAQYARLAGYGRNDRPSLVRALRDIGEVYIGRSHDALTDAQNTATLLKISQNSAELRKVRERISLVSATPEETLSQPYTLADKFGSGLLDLMSGLDDSDCAPDTDKNDFNSES